MKLDSKLSQALLLITAAFAMLLDTVDGTVVSLALPILAKDFGLDVGTISWVSMTYMLVIAGTILIFGKIAGNGHLKNVFTAGILLFTIGSLLCALSFSFELLVASRVIQGLGASMLAACIPMLCVTYLPERILGMSLGVVMAMGSVGVILGPAVGGLILSTASWHWIFIINIPIGAVILLLAAKTIPRDEEAVKEHFDFIGAVMIFLSMGAGIFCIERFPNTGFAPWLCVLFVFAAALFVLFVRRQLKISYPLTNPRVFLSWKATAVTLAFLLIQVICAVTAYLLPFFFQLSMGYGSFESGLLLLIPALVGGVLSIPFGRLSDIYGRRGFVCASTLILTMMTLMLAFVHPEFGVWYVITALLLDGICFGIAGGASSSRIIDNMPEGEETTGSTIMMILMYFGGVIGTALSAGIFTALTSGIGNGAISFAALPENVFLYAFHGVMAVSVILAVLSFIFSFTVREKKTG